MSLIKCEECGKEVSDKARSCPNCGYTLNENIKNIDAQNVNSDITNDKGENFGLSLAGIICSFLGLSIIGLIFGIISIGTNKNKSNTSKTLGIISVVISSIKLVVMLILFIALFAGLMYE